MSGGDGQNKLNDDGTPIVPSPGLTPNPNSSIVEEPVTMGAMLKFFKQMELNLMATVTSTMDAKIAKNASSSSTIASEVVVDNVEDPTKNKNALPKVNLHLTML